MDLVEEGVLQGPWFEANVKHPSKCPTLGRIRNFLNVQPTSSLHAFCLGTTPLMTILVAKGAPHKGEKHLRTVVDAGNRGAHLATAPTHVKSHLSRMACRTGKGDRGPNSECFDALCASAEVDLSTYIKWVADHPGCSQGKCDSKHE